MVHVWFTVQCQNTYCTLALHSPDWSSMTSISSYDDLHPIIRRCGRDVRTRWLEPPLPSRASRCFSTYTTMVDVMDVAWMTRIWMNNHWVATRYCRMQLLDNSNARHQKPRPLRHQNRLGLPVKEKHGEPQRSGVQLRRSSAIRNVDSEARAHKSQAQVLHNH